MSVLSNESSSLKPRLIWRPENLLLPKLLHAIRFRLSGECGRGVRQAPPTSPFPRDETALQSPHRERQEVLVKSSLHLVATMQHKVIATTVKKVNTRSQSVLQFDHQLISNFELPTMIS